MANDNLKLLEVAVRIREMREILEWSTITMAQKTGVTVEEYEAYESGKVDFPFSFLHKCAVVFDLDMTDLLEGRSSNLLTSYTVGLKTLNMPTI